jgi:hypothetical protein
MAYHWIENQPLVSENSLAASCCGQSSFAQLITQDDNAHIQFAVYPCEGTETPEFSLANFEGYWFGEDGLVCSIISAPGAWDAFWSNPDLFSFFQVTVTVTSMSAGSLVVTLDGAETYTITTAGTYVLYFRRFTASTQININFSSSDGWVGCFDQSTLQILGIPISWKLGIFDSDGVAVAINDNPIFTGNYMTFKTALEDYSLPDGCYRFGLIDPCENDNNQNEICNPNFDNETCWVADSELSGWVVDTGTGKADYSESAATSHTFVNTSTNLGQGLTYVITWKLDSVAGDVRARVSIGNQVGAWRTTPGTYVDTITCNDLGVLGDKLILIGETVSPGFSSMEVDFVRMSIATEDIVANELSVPFRLSQVPDEGGCWYLLEGCNGSDQFDFEFSVSGFNPFIRLTGELAWATPEIDGEVFRLNSGRSIVPYWDRVWKEELRLDQVPAYVHQFLSILVAFDNFFINGNKYAPSEAAYQTPGPLNDPKQEATAVLLIEKSTQKVRKVNCNGINATCVARVTGTYKEFEDGEIFQFQSGVTYDFNG